MFPDNAHSLGGKAMAIRLRAEALYNYYKNPNICKFCGKAILVGPNQKVASVRKKKFCDQKCAARFNNQIPKRKRVLIVSVCQRCGKEILGRKHSYLRKFCPECRYRAIKTKKDAFEVQSKSSGHKYIRDAARDVVMSQKKTWACIVCGYTKLVEVCHIKPVKDFPPEALLTDINSPDNLILLCRNHHWEFDHDKEIRKAILLKIESAGGVEPPTQSV